jgi:hypothetical protein
MALTEGAANLMQRLARLPAAQRRHMSILCSVESLSRFPCAINTTFRKLIHIRWCCTDQLSPPRFSGTTDSSGSPSLPRCLHLVTDRESSRIYEWFGVRCELASVVATGFCGWVSVLQPWLSGVVCFAIEAPLVCPACARQANVR